MPRPVRRQVSALRWLSRHANVAVVNGWGKVFSWHPWGSTVLSHLVALPVNVTFHSFQEIIDAGVPRGTDVVFMYGLPNTSWSGGRFWKEPGLSAAMEAFVAGGGGLMAFQAPSFVRGAGELALSTVLGVSMRQHAVNLGKRSRDANAGGRGDSDDAEEVSYHAEGRLTQRGGEAVIDEMTDCIMVEADPKATVLYDFSITGQEERTPGIVTNRYGRGRTVYINGASKDLRLTKLVKELLFQAAGQPDLSQALDLDGAEGVFVYLYPKQRRLALLNELTRPADAILRCDPKLIDAAGRTVLVTDVATGQSVYEGAARELRRGVPVRLPPDCVKLLAYEVR